MPTEFRFICGLRNGLHARPASMISETVGRFAAAVTICKGGGPGVDARSVLSVVGLDVRLGDECLIVVGGADAERLIAALKELIENRLVDGDDYETPDEQSAPPATTMLPCGLRRLGVPHVCGRSVSGGAGVGAAFIVEAIGLSSELAGAHPGSLEAELESARDAVDATRESLKRRAETAHGMERDLLRAHAEIAGDVALSAEIEAEVRAGKTAPQAVVAAAGRFMAGLRGAASQYIRDRVVDVQDVAMQVLGRLVPGEAAWMNPRLERDSVVFAESLTPSQFLKMDRRMLKGLVVAGVGATSHTVILARSHRIPTLIDVFNPTGLVHAGQRVVVDGEGGFVVTDAGAEVVRYYERESATRARRESRFLAAAGQAAQTADGARFEVAANASTPEEAHAASAAGADGIGLLRTELLFLERDTPPTEQEQLDAYTAVARATAVPAVNIRTFDIGGDKPASYLSMPREDNPFLGVRGLRLYPHHPGTLRTQLRAIVRAASVTQGISVMAPMVANPQESAWFREQVRQVQAELSREGVAVDWGMPVGVMIEVPSAALAMERIAEHVDFFSIGTNDLCQYWMAADRGNPGVAHLCNPREPSFLRLLRVIVDGAKTLQKWIGVCGEMASDPVNLPLMIGLGLDGISVSNSAVLGIRSAVRGADASKCRALLERAMSCRDAAEVGMILKGDPWRHSGTTPILDQDMIEIDSDAMDKHEAIKAAVDLLFIAGRSDSPREVEDAVWAREAVYSTGLGFGFAIPHCKTDAVTAPSLAVLKLKTPTDWGSSDGEPVKIVILLAVSASDDAGGGGATHMKTFAKLARKLMHEAFRERLLAADSPASVRSCLGEELGID